MVLGVRIRRKGQAAEEAVEEHVRNIAAFPLAIPLMAGPGAITARPRTVYGTRSFIALKASRSLASACSKRAKSPSKKHCASHDGNRRGLTSYVPRRAWLGYGANRAGGPKHVICSRRFTAGSPRASTPPI